MDNEVNNFYEFGSYRLDPRRKLLLRDGDPIVLTWKAFETLLVLVQQSGQVVSKEELMRTLWPRTFVEDSNLTQHISMVRKALGETPTDRRYIITYPGRGYSFVETVKVIPDDASDKTSRAEDQTDGVPAHSAFDLPSANCPGPMFDEESGDAAHPMLGILATGGRSFWHRAKAWIAVACAGLAVFAGLGLWLRHTATAKEADAEGRSPQIRIMLAVLPFENLSSDPEQEYFSDGLTEETITDLGELNPDQLGVIARTSSTSYKHTDKTIAQIGRELGVDYVLEGSVRQEGGVARVSAQLIRVTDQAHLWAHTYERETGGLLALQNELGTAIAQQVRVKLTPSDDRAASRYAADPEAYQLYLKGRFYLDKRTWPEIDQSARYFQEAIDKDPGFALAYAGLAASHLANAIGSPLKFDPKAKSAALRALELDEDLAEAHIVLGVVKADFEYDWPAAEHEFKQAIQLNPNSADAHFHYAWNYLVPLGRFDQAIAEMKKALELDPFSRIDNTILGCTFFYARRYDESLKQFEKAISLNPGFFVTYYHLAWLYSQLGRYPEAIAALTKGRSVAGDARAKVAASEEADLKRAFAADGANGFWQEILKHQDIGEFGAPQVHARLGDKDKALQGLENDYKERAPLNTLVNVDPAFDPLRSDPRYRDLVRRMGLVPNADSH
jgi:TolB-like protein/DNA-binding winged helix-turn-helix (wHTH) protein/Flp pilus assembly protein TadD